MYSVCGVEIKAWCTQGSHWFQGFSQDGKMHTLHYADIWCEERLFQIGVGSQSNLTTEPLRKSSLPSCQ